MQVRIEQDGIFGVSACYIPTLGFAAHVVDPDKPFLSETGYRSFIGCHAEMTPGQTPDTIAKRLIESYIHKDCKGKRRPLEKSYAERIKAERQPQEIHRINRNEKAPRP